MFRDFVQVLEHAKKLDTKDLVVANPEDKAILIAVNDAFQMGLIRPVLVGDKPLILELLMELGIRKDGYEIYNVNSKEEAAMISVKLVSKHENAVLMKGHLQSSVLLKEVLDKDHGLTTENLLFHIGVLEIPSYHKLLFVTDSVMNVLPTEEEKMKIVWNTHKFVTSLGIYLPKIALISSLEVVNNKIPSTVEAANIVKKLKDEENFYIGGPFSVDVAISHESAKTKGVDHVVAGDADIMIFPNVESANTFYKAITFLANSTPVGLLLGASNPIVLTGRSDSYKSQLYSIALAVVSTDIIC